MYTKTFKFDTLGYYNFITTDPEASNSRRVDKGYADITAKLVDRVLNNTLVYGTRCPAILELGVGGGGSHANWAKFSNCRVYGIEIFHPDNGVEYDDRKKHLDNYNGCLDTLSRTTGVTVLFGHSAFSEDSARQLRSLNFEMPFDVIVDDTWSRVRPAEFGGPSIDLIRVWDQHLSDHGIITCESPFGNGAEYPGGITQDIIDSGSKILANEGMVILDMTEYADLNGPSLTDIEYPICILGLYAKDYAPFIDVIEKYKHNIIAGEDNLYK